MTDLAKLVVNLEAQTAKFQKELETANKKLNKFSKAGKKSISSLQRTIGGLALGAVTKKIIDATRVQEAALKQLEQGLITTGNAAGYTVSELTAAASRLQGVTIFGDEQIIEAQSKLVTFTDIAGKQFDRVTELALDLSTRFKTDLSSASIQLGKALNDPVANLSALSRAGIQFTKDQKSLINNLVKTGDKAKAQTIILDELEKQFGGSARAARDSFGGALTGLNNAFGDLLEGKSGLKEAQVAIEKLTATLSDPKTQAAADKVTSSLITGFTKVIEVMAEVPDFAKWLGEELAAAIHGPADLIRIEDELADKTEKLTALQASLDKVMKDRAETGGIIAGIETAALGRAGNQNTLLEDRIRKLNEEVEALRAKRDLFKELQSSPAPIPSSGQEAAPVTSSSTSTGNLNFDLEKAKAAADAIISETTPRLAQLQEKIAQTTTLFSKGLLTKPQFDQALALYDSQIKAITEKDILQFEEKIVRMEEQFLSEYEILNNQKNERLALLEEEKLSKIRTEEEIAKLKIQVQQKYLKDKKKLDEAAAKAELQTTFQVANGVLGILGAFAGKSFKAQKALAIAEGILNIATGVTKALNNPYPANLGFAAHVAAEGVGLLSTIKKTNISSGGGDLNVSSGASSSGSYKTPAASNQIQSRAESEEQNKTKIELKLDMTVDDFTEQPMRSMADRLQDSGQDRGYELSIRD